MEKKAQNKEIKKDKVKPEVRASLITASKVQKQAAVIEKKEEFVGLHNLKVPKGAHKGKRILGRGSSSGHGKTSTRGSKGQTSRAGRDTYLGFEGGQTPLIRRIPKRGFVNRFKKEFQIVNLKDLKRLKEKVINPEILQQEGLIKDKNKPVKLLGEGEIKEPLNIQVQAFSKKAQDKIKNAGGKFEVLLNV